MIKLTKAIIVILVLASGSLQAQELSYEKGDHLFNAGIGLGYYGNNFIYRRAATIPAVEASLELGIHEYFGVGAYAGLVSWNYDAFNFDGRQSIFTIGARGSFHYSSLLEELLESDFKSDKLDLYVTLIMGLEFRSYNGDFTTSNSADIFVGPVLGARYYFNPKLAVYAEGGRGSFSILKFGITLKI